MLTIEKVKSKILISVQRNYKFWRIGIANNIQHIRMEKDYPKCLQYWEIDTFSIAKEMENSFLQMGCMPCSLSKLVQDEKEEDKEIFIYIY
ncbi:MAG: hypothetical protein GQ574_27380 [Crocinitomix sp.]|nr:hypothetical protein [Crocinitomix sp.]